jgi:hypothetical protein
MPNSKNIPSANEQLNEEQLLNYLENNLSDNERHALEMQMADNDFINDAVEGLQDFKSKQNIQHYVNQLNHHLIKQTTKKRIRKRKRKLKQQDWIVISVMIVIVLCLLGYVVVKEFEKNDTVINTQKN